MGIRYYCDRCGSIVNDKSELMEVDLCYDDLSYDELGYLCEDCAEDLKEFMGMNTG